MAQLGIIDKIFGPANETFVTWTQISDLATEIYQKLNIIEDYQMAQSEFAANFIDYFVAQTASKVFSKVNLSDALRSLSQYDFQADLQPSQITQELTNIFTINSTRGKELLVVNQLNYENLKKSSHIAVQGSTSDSFIDIFSASFSASFVQDKSSDWSRQNTSFNYQLSELNQFSSNYIEWTRSGNIIVPKSIQVAKLVKSLMQKNMVFSRVKREYYDAPFQRSVSLNTLSSTPLPSNFVEISERLVNLEKQYESINIKNQDLELRLINSSYLREKQYQSIIMKNQDFELRLTNLSFSRETVRLMKGSWAIKISANNGRVVSNGLKANFTVQFKTPPLVFYTIKERDIGTYKLDYAWSFQDEIITNSSVSIDIRFWGDFKKINFKVEWIAIGFV